MKCPGQDSRYWKPGAIFETECPGCGNRVEFFKDDSSRVCKKCGHRFLNPQMDFGCASYCKYAEQCLGTLSPELVSRKEDLLKDRVAVEMKRRLKKDFKKIGHATRVARYAEQIGKREGANLAVVLTAAYLHGLENKEKGREGSVAVDILKNLGAADSLVEEVSEILLRKEASSNEEGVNYRVLQDAVLAANLEERQKEGLPEDEALRVRMEKSFLTDTGRMLGKEMLSKGRAR